MESGFGVILGIFLGICVLSSLLVVVHILTDGRSNTSQRNIAQTQTQPTQDSNQDSKAVVVPETKRVPMEPRTFADKQPISQRTVGNKLLRISAPIITTITRFLSKTGINRVYKQPTDDREPSTTPMATPTTEKDISPPQQQPYDTGLPLHKQFSPPLPNITSAESEIDPITISPEQKVPYMEPMNEEPEVNLIDILAVGDDQPVLDSRQEESEPIEDEVKGITDTGDAAELEEANENEQEENPTAQDSVLSLFSEEVVEEDDVMKIAVDLDDIDAQSLSEEIHDLINQFRNL